ncbi:CHAT domain-containing protein [Streptomyces sp. NPDC046915]|uniref:CHAT domain-containing tetratricopeptide repeat protein n=1 Tax=Streptomyces sp. NPDC046915 TaxID=3155257 RepID=UPI0033F01833
MPDNAELRVLYKKLTYARQLLAQQRISDARRVLLAVEAAADGVAETGLQFRLYRLLGQATRMEGRLREAEAHYAKSLQIAEDESQRSIALEGMALTAARAGLLKRAIRLFETSAEAALAAEDIEGYVVVLQNHANVLTQHGLDGAEDALRRALAVPGAGAVARGVITDNLAQELGRQGRYDEAAELAATAARTLTAAGADLGAAKAWMNMAYLGRQAGRDADDQETAFTRAHDLLKRVSDFVDKEHYALYEMRVMQIQARTKALLQERNPSTNIDLVFIAQTVLGTNLANDAERKVEQGDFAAAEELSYQAESHWERMRATHKLPRVWNQLGLVHICTGAAERALEVLSRCRHVAHGLGDAHAECVTLRHLAMIENRFGIGEEGELGLLLRARRLGEVAQRQRATRLENAVHPAGPMGGIIDGRLAVICALNGAWELADFYIKYSLAAAESPAHGSPRQLATRLGIRLRILQERRLTDASAETETAAAEMVDRLTKLVEHHHADPQLLMGAYGAIGRYRFKSGERSPALFSQLVAACDAYEDLRRKALDIGSLAEYETTVAPPYEEAVATALGLGRPAQAFALAERARGRSLLDARRHTRPAVATGAADDAVLDRERDLWRRQRGLREELSARREGEEAAARVQRLTAVARELDRVRHELTDLWDRLSTAHPELRIHRMSEPITAGEAARLLGCSSASALVAFWSSSESLYAFVLEADRADPALLPLGRREDLGWQQYADAMRALQQAHSASGQAAALDAMLRSPLHRAIREALEGAGLPGTPVLVVPHDLLHAAPLHLPSASTRTQGGPEQMSRPTRYLPSASLLRTGSSALHRDGTVLVGGFPGTGPQKLTYYRSECAEVADRLGGTARLDEQATCGWLETAVNTEHRLSLVHLACHGKFDELRPERSGLFLAGSDVSRPTEVMRTERLAAMDWTGALVTLSACGSGRHQVKGRDELVGLGRALLSAGARGLVLSLWPVADFDTGVLMSLFYESLAAAPAWDADVVAGTLTTAQQRMGSWSAADLIVWACSRLESSRRLPDTDRLSLAALARAHHRAGNHDESDRWSAHVSRAEQTPLSPGPTPNWQEQCRLAAGGNGYSRRMFPSAAAWGPFVFYGA